MPYAETLRLSCRLARPRARHARFCRDREIHERARRENASLLPAEVHAARGLGAGEGSKQEYGMPMYVREGTDFASSPALMYIMVSYNHQKKETLQQYIDTSNKYWREKMKDTQIERVGAEKRANGMPDFEIYRFVNPSDTNQPYELIAFGEDKDNDGNNFLMKIALSARSEKALKAAEADFRAGLHAH